MYTKGKGEKVMIYYSLIQTTNRNKSSNLIVWHMYVYVCYPDEMGEERGEKREERRRRKSMIAAIRCCYVSNEQTLYVRHQQ
jgi:hypothetical protein